MSLQNPLRPTVRNRRNACMVRIGERDEGSTPIRLCSTPMCVCVCVVIICTHCGVPKGGETNDAHPLRKGLDQLTVRLFETTCIFYRVFQYKL